MKLWYKQPATTWTESLPLGNGRMGAMVYGTVKEERFALNEESLWSGYPKDKTVKDPYKHWEAARALVREKRFSEADAYIEAHFLGDYSEAYLPFGELTLTFPDLDTSKVIDYERSLDLETALSTVAFNIDDTHYCRESFISAVDQVFVIRLSADKKSALSFNIAMTSKLKYNVVCKDTLLSLSGIAPSVSAPSYFPAKNPVIYDIEDAKKGMRFGSLLEIETTGGSVESFETHIQIKEADEVTLKLCMRTSFNGFDKQPYLEGRSVEASLQEDRNKIKGKSYETLRSAHIREHKNFFDRVSLSFGDVEQDIPTDERLIAFQTNQNDPYLYSLLFQYGRYLLIASSRPGTLPANLQGIWNDQERPPFSCNYTTNINLQMNYWPAESSNLSEMHQPLFDFIDILAKTGKRTAEEYYHADGAVIHHNSDIWGLSTPVGHDLKGMSGCGSWNGGFGWLTQHLMTHYEYTLDRDFLSQRAYPSIKLAAEYFMSILETNEEGYLWAVCSTSPENTFRYQDEKCHQVRFATMSNAIIREVFKHVLTCCELLDHDRHFAEEVRTYLDKMYPYKIGKEGSLLEWDEEFEEEEPHHRHISHLYGLYPGEEIQVHTTPELAKACERTLIDRTDVGTGWSLGWKIITWAKLQDGDHALKLLKKQLKLSTETRVIVAEGEGSGSYLNLFDAHPPFQIDGNFAAVSGVTEMLMQSYGDTILLLPALPSELPQGAIKGLRAKQAVEVDIEFKNGTLVSATFKSKVKKMRTVHVIYRNRRIQMTLSDDREVVVKADDFLI